MPALEKAGGDHEGETERGISFRDAQDIVEKRMDSGPQAGSYASKAGSKPMSKNLGNLNVSCQTDLTWPLASEAPLPLISVSSPTRSLVAEAASRTAQSTSKFIEPIVPVSHITIQIPCYICYSIELNQRFTKHINICSSKTNPFEYWKKLLLMSARTPGKNPRLKVRYRKALLRHQNLKIDSWHCKLMPWILLMLWKRQRNQNKGQK